MNTPTDKTQEKKSQSASDSNSQIQSGGESTFQFVDNRPAASAQRNLQELVNKSSQVKKAAQLQAMAKNYSVQQQHPIQKKASPESDRRENNTGLPDNLKTGIENLSSYSMDDVKVHYNSNKPAQLQAHAYAQGTDIHLASGQEKHLPHEAWHVVQKPTIQMKGGLNVNDDERLEKKTLQQKKNAKVPNLKNCQPCSNNIIQRYDITYGKLKNDSATDMHVLIYGKNDPDISNGSQPSVKPNWWPSAPPDLNNYMQSYMRQGHLLNDNLGGLGNKMKNLTPITGSTNTQHLHSIERQVKDEVLSKDNYVEYRVRADYSTHPSFADLGNNPPVSIKPYLKFMAGEIWADYNVYSNPSGNLIGGLPGEIGIKNEGPQNKGNF